MPPAPLSCLSCRERLAHTRGLCTACYGRAQKAVRAGLATWAALEAAKLANWPRRLHMENGYFFSSRILFRVAQHAYERAKSAPGGAALNPDDALVAVLFSAATLEAFVMELAIEAHFGADLLSKPPYLRELADILEETESSRGSVRLKYLLAKVILPGQPYDKGAQPYQDFDLLFSLRDAIIHNKPEKIAPDPPKIARQLVTRRLCEPEVPGTTSSFLGRLKTRELARWACNVVADMVASLRKEFPVDNSSSPPTLLHMPLWATGFDRVE